MSARLMATVPPVRPDLQALLDKVKDHVMTKEDIAAQRKSWVVGETMLQHPEMTRDEAVAIYEKHCE